MARVDRSVSATAVSVGFAVPIVGKLPQPTTYRLSWSQLRWSRSTTLSVRLTPMRCVPTWCPAP